MLLPFKVKAPRHNGLNSVINGSMDYLSLDLLRLGLNDKFEFNTSECEVAVIPFSGCADIEVNGEIFRLERKGVFTESASALLIPRNTNVRFSSSLSAELAICKAKTDVDGEVIYISKADVKEKTVGKGIWERKVVDIIDSKTGASRIVLGETFNQPGGWSSFPPHKHDTIIPGKEAKMEEIYLFRVDRPEGFGTQTIYNDENNFSFKIEDYDAVAIPWGYHPVSAMPGYSLYYLWFLAGEGRTLVPNTDPNFKWLEE